MSTHSTIAMLYKDGTVKSIYCHFDGYLSGVGKCLLDNYSGIENVDKVKQMMELGDMSVLDTEVNPTGEHSYENPEAGVSVFYGRDRGEEETEGFEYENYESFLAKGYKEYYCYLFIETMGLWEYLNDGALILLEDAKEQEE
jgi:hypothetical protein